MNVEIDRGRPSWRRLILLVAFLGPPLGACSEDGTSEATTSGFCTEVAEALGHAADSVAGLGFIDTLRSVDTGGLEPDDRRRYDAVVSALEDSIDDFAAGVATDGWTAEHVITTVGRWCDPSELPAAFTVVP